MTYNYDYYKNYVESSGEFTLINIHKEKQNNKFEIKDKFGYKYYLLKQSLKLYFDGKTKFINPFNKKNKFINDNIKTFVEHTNEFKYLKHDFDNKNLYIHFQDNDLYKYRIVKNHINDYFINNNINFSKFHKYNPYTIENIKKWITKNNYAYEILSNNYIDSKEKLKFNCKEHGVFYISWVNIISNKQGCSKCAKNDFYYAKEKFFKQLNKYNDVLIDDYVNVKISVKIKFSCCNNIDYIIPNVYTNKRKCDKCNLSKSKLFKIKFYNMLNDKGDELLSDYINGDVKVLIKYKDCKHEPHYITPYNYSKGKGCPLCYIDSISGENSVFWNPNLTEQDRYNNRKYDEYKIWVKNVFEKFNYTCVKCGINQGNLNAHHIYNFSQYNNLRTNVSNGIVFCEKCHLDFHKKYGWKNNNMEQINLFLKWVV